MKQKKVLIITYYWPPTGGGGVYRWLKFVKYLPQFGWEPIVYTPLNPEAGITDETLLTDISKNVSVLKKKIIEPYALYKLITNKPKTFTYDNFVHTHEKLKKSFKEKVSIFIRGNLFIPDARCLWIKPSVKYLTNYLKENPVDVIVTTGTPHSMHLIGLRLSRITKIPWMADFRDPWTNIEYYHLLRLTKYANNKHIKLEKKVLTSADIVVTVSPSWAKLMENLGAKNVYTINNGYDDEDFSFLPVEIDDKFTITHVGVLNESRNPYKLWKAISEICFQSEDFRNNLKLQFLGTTDFTVKEYLKELELLQYTDFFGYVKHSDALKITAASAVLLLLLNNTPDIEGRIPAKMYEYIAARRPILQIAPEKCDAAQILYETNSGYRADFDDTEEIKKNILKLYNNFKNTTTELKFTNIEKYSRKKLTQKLSIVLDNMLT